MAATETLSADEQRLAELGYKQELHRGWSALLELRDLVLDHLGARRVFTTFGQAWNNGGPIAISIGWPLDQPADPDSRLFDVRAGLGDGQPQAASTTGRPSWAARAGDGSPAGST